MMVPTGKTPGSSQPHHTPSKKDVSPEVIVGSPDAMKESMKGKDAQEKIYHEASGATKEKTKMEALKTQYNIGAINRRRAELGKLRPKYLSKEIALSSDRLKGGGHSDYNKILRQLTEKTQEFFDAHKNTKKWFKKVDKAKILRLLNEIDHLEAQRAEMAKKNPDLYDLY